MRWLPPPWRSGGDAVPAATVLAKSQNCAPSARGPAENRPESFECPTPSELDPLASAAGDRSFRPPWAFRRNGWHDRCRAHRRCPSSPSRTAGPPSLCASILPRPVARSRPRWWHHPAPPAGRTSDHPETTDADSRPSLTVSAVSRSFWVFRSALLLSLRRALSSFCFCCLWIDDHGSFGNLSVGFSPT